MGWMAVPNRMNFRKSSKGGVSFSIQKFILQILDLYKRLFRAFSVQTNFLSKDDASNCLKMFFLDSPDSCACTLLDASSRGNKIIYYILKINSTVFQIHEINFKRSNDPDATLPPTSSFIRSYKIILVPWRSSGCLLSPLYRLFVPLSFFLFVFLP